MLSSQDGRTALHRASISGHTDVVKLLVDSGAHIDNIDKVSTEPCMVLHRDISLIISIYHTLPPSRSCPPLSILRCKVLCSFTISIFSVQSLVLRCDISSIISMFPNHTLTLSLPPTHVPPVSPLCHVLVNVSLL